MDELIFDIDLNQFAQKIISPDPKIRVEAIESVRDLSKKSIKSKEVLSMLISSLDGEADPQIISRLTKLIGKLGDSTVLLLLKKFLWHPDARVVANTLEGLGFIYSLDIIPVILPFLNSPDNRIKANAARALYGLNPSLAIEKLTEMVNSEEVFFRDSGTYILSTIADSPCQDLLIELLLRESDTEIIKKAIAALCGRGDASTVDKIEKVMRNYPDHPKKKILADIHESVSQRLRAHMTSIQNINKVADISRLIEIYNNGNDKEKEQVCLRLFDIGDESALPLLKKAANDDNTAIRYSAKKALNNVFSKIAQKNQPQTAFRPDLSQASPHLSPRPGATKQPHPQSERVKKADTLDFSDVISLAQEKPSSEPKYIEEIDMAFLVLDLNNNDPVKRAEAVSKLLFANRNSGGVREAIKYLVERLYIENEPQVKSQILRVIGTLGSAADIPVLKKFLEDESQEYRIRANALEGLGCIDSPDVFDMLIPYLNHGDNRIKANAVIAAWKRNPDSTFNIISDMIHSPNVAMRDSAAYGLLILKSNDRRLINLMLELFIRETTPDIITKLTQGLSILGDEQILSDMEKMLPNASALKKPHIETIISKLKSKFESLSSISAHDIVREEEQRGSDFDIQFKLYEDTQKREAQKHAHDAEHRPAAAKPGHPPADQRPKFIEKDDGTKIPLKNIEAHLFELNHPDEKVRLNAIMAIFYYLKNGLPHEHFNQVEMLLTLSLNDASLRVRKEAFEAYQLIQTHRAVILRPGKPDGR